MRTLTELDKKVLRAEFPQLSFSEDADIDRYFELRSLGDQRQALDIYNRTLLVKYPQKERRVLLMSYYRKRDVRFKEVLADALAELAQKKIQEIKKIIDFFAAAVAPLDLTDVRTLIRVCEKIVRSISLNRFESVHFSRKHTHYAQWLLYREKEMEKAADIIRMYVTDTLSSVRTFRQESHTRATYGFCTEAHGTDTSSTIDFSQLVFTAEQVRTIEIAKTITKIEDRVLAYAIKYWHRYDDRAFENTVLLYSRKYKTHHYNIFHSIKTGRSHQWKDEDILHLVLAHVASGYYYSISGDLYLQRNWHWLKARLVERAEHHHQKGKKVPATHRRSSTPHARKTAGTRARTRARKKELPALPSEKISKKDSGESKQKDETAGMERVFRHNTKNVRTCSSRASRTGTHAEARHSDIVTSSPVHQEGAATVERSSPPEETVESIAHIVKRITGKDYGVYRELFFKEVRTAIRTVLNRATVRRGLRLRARKNNAEDTIYHFLHAHYDDPYQRWPNSHEYQQVHTLGFSIHSLEPIIVTWAESEGL